MKLKYKILGYLLPHVTYCKSESSTNAKFIAIYNITNIDSVIQIISDYYVGQIKSIEVDGTILPEFTTYYKFNEPGLHTVKYTLLEGVTSVVGLMFSLSPEELITLPGITDISLLSYLNIKKVNIGKDVVSYSLPDKTEYITVNKANPIYDSREDCNAIIRTAVNKLVKGCKNTIIPDTVTSIGNSAFNGCTGLTSINIPNSVINIGDSAFRGCTNLTSIDISDNVKTIGEYAFYSDTSLTSITIGNSVESIGNYALSYSKLTSIVIPKSVTNIGTNICTDCNLLASIVVENGNTVYDSRDNCNAIIKTSTNELITGCKNTVIPNNVTSIGVGSFLGSQMTSIIIPDSVTAIKAEAFYKCNLLTSVTLGNSVQTIGRNSFNYCSNLSSIVIPDSTTSIGEYAFRDSGLTSVTLGIGLTNLNSAFYYCTKLNSITSLATTAPTILANTFYYVKTNGTLTVPTGSTGYDVWMGTSNYYLGKYNWTKVEQ